MSGSPAQAMTSTDSSGRPRPPRVGGEQPPGAQTDADGSREGHLPAAALGPPACSTAGCGPAWTTPRLPSCGDCSPQPAETPRRTRRATDPVRGNPGQPSPWTPTVDGCPIRGEPRTPSPTTPSWPRPRRRRGAPGGAITVALCGSWDHEPPCPLAPHHTRAHRSGDGGDACACSSPPSRRRSRRCGHSSRRRSPAGGGTDPTVTAPPGTWSGHRPRRSSPRRRTTRDG